VIRDQQKTAAWEVFFAEGFDRIECPGNKISEQPEER
jgi:hypothetical protein